MRTDGQVEVMASTKPSYSSMASQVTPVPTVPRNGASAGPEPPSGHVGP